MVMMHRLLPVATTLLLLLVLGAASPAAAKEQLSAKTRPDKAGATKVGKRKPLVTVDIVYGTAELLYDIYEFTWTSFLADTADKASQTISIVLDDVVLPDVLGILTEKVGLKKDVVLDWSDTATASALHVKALIANTSSTVYWQMNEGVVTMINRFERVMPQYTGLVPKTLEDFIFFIVYIIVTLYILTLTLLYVLRTILRSFCFFCCCGCCRHRAKSARTLKGEKMKTIVKDRTSETVEGKKTTTADKSGKAEAVVEKDKAAMANVKNGKGQAVKNSKPKPAK